MFRHPPPYGMALLEITWMWASRLLTLAASPVGKQRVPYLPLA